MSVLYTFPGQGSQSAGMLSRLPAGSAVEESLATAAAVLGHDPLALETEAALASTVAVQLALLIAGVATARHLAAMGCQPDMVAGMSVGAYPAAVVAGVLDYGDALRLVRLRARLMEEAFPSGYGMVAIVGLDERQVRDIVARIHCGNAAVYVANLNAERQIVIAGANGALQAAADSAMLAGAARCTRLAASVPSHCELLDSAARTLRERIAAVTLQRPRIPYLSGSQARALHDTTRIAADLAGNVACEVNWRDTVQLAWERGARLAVEMACGDVLTRLMLPAFAEGQAVACSNTRVETIAALIKRADCAR